MNTVRHDDERSARSRAGVVARVLAAAAILSALWSGILSTRGALRGQTLVKEEPINYGSNGVSDPVARLQKHVAAGEVTLKYDQRRGYLPAVLEHLKVPVSSQLLVFSKTSFQFRRITPRAPRAVYFSDSTYVSYVQGGNVVELSAVDPKMGAIFYSLSQQKTARPKFSRHTHECTQCHVSTLTKGVPGHMVRSVFTAADGLPVLRAGTFTTDHTSPLKERWGGWYVTGTHGSAGHMGNVVVRDMDEPEDFDFAAGANITDLSDRVDTAAYLSRHSDIVSLMVLGHQTQMHNLITRAAVQTRRALEDQKVLDEFLERESDHLRPSTQRRIAHAARPLLKYMLFVGEFRLTGPIEGTSGFAEGFASLGPRDRAGRSLRDFDLESRLFKNPCSYLIYAPSFDALPPDLLDHVYRALWDVLTGEDTSEDFAGIAADDRQAILEILLDTRAGLPEYWTPERGVLKSTAEDPAEEADAPAADL